MHEAMPTDPCPTTLDASDILSKKFRLASELNQTVSTSQIGEKIMDTSIQLSMQEILTVASEVSSYLHDHTQKYHNLGDAVPPVPAVANATNVSCLLFNANVNASSSHLKKLY